MPRVVVMLIEDGVLLATSPLLQMNNREPRWALRNTLSALNSSSLLDRWGRTSPEFRAHVKGVDMEYILWDTVVEHECSGHLQTQGDTPCLISLRRRGVIRS